MVSQKISISNISYKNDESVRILTSVLSKWLSDPKTLHFTSPNSKYPFNINHWVSTFYKMENVETYVLKNEHWIIGHLSVKIDEKKNIACTTHSLNLVPFTICEKINYSIKTGKLADIAPTVLKLLGIEIPNVMKGKPLIK